MTPCTILENNERSHCLTECYVLFIVHTSAGEFEAGVFSLDAVLLHFTLAGGAMRAGVTLQREPCKKNVQVI